MWGEKNVDLLQRGTPNDKSSVFGRTKTDRASSSSCIDGVALEFVV